MSALSSLPGQKLLTFRKLSSQSRATGASKTESQEPQESLGTSFQVNSQDVQAVKDLFPKSLEDIPASYRPNPESNKVGTLIGGEIVHGAELKPVYSNIAVVNGDELEPVLLGFEPDVGPSEAQAAADAAEAAWAKGKGEWPQMSLENRYKAVKKFLDKTLENKQELGHLVAMQAGKTGAAGIKEVVRTAEFIDQVMDNARESEKPYAEAKGSSTHHIRHRLRPKGPTMIVGPANYPINETLDKALSAVLLGNPVFIKTPKNCSLAFGKMMKDFAECFPPGVVNVVPGSGRKTLKEGIADTDTDGKATFKQLTWVGGKNGLDATVGAHPNANRLEVYAGLGAKNPAVITPGATEDDLKNAAKLLLKGSLGSNGRRCTAEKIFYVPKEHAEKFEELYSAEVNKLTLGMPWDEKPGQTPLPMNWGTEDMGEFIDDAVSKGAKVINRAGGQMFHSLMVPAVLSGVTPGMRIFDEEQFGPVNAIVHYDNLEQVVEWDAQSDYGQQISLWGPDSEVVDVGDQFLANGYGGINYNAKCERGPDSTPFTGARDSGRSAMSSNEVLGRYSNVTRVRAYKEKTMALDHARSLS